MKVRLVGFEAWNITRYMFGTNKRREIAGASELITYLDRTWVDEALRMLFPGYSDAWRIERDPAELLTAGAGAVKVLVRDEEDARRLVTHVTRAALDDAPGLDVYGAVGGAFDWSDAVGLSQAVGDLTVLLESARMSRPGPQARFQRIPVVDDCLTTGLPAAMEIILDGTAESRSVEAYRKWEAYARTSRGDGLARLAELAGMTPARLRRVAEYLQDRADWVAVVYVDGNGLGEVFSHFERLVAGDDARTYADTLRSFTVGLDECVRQSLTAAIAAVGGRPAAMAAAGYSPVQPLILGGDDMILLCDGELALPLVAELLRAYEQCTGSRPGIAEPLRHAGRSPRLSAAAGVAIVKPHHPFEAAARLAHELLLEAKQVKTWLPGRSAVAFHVLYDSTDARLARLRGAGGLEYCLSAQPYVVSDGVADDGWGRGRRWTDLTDRVRVLGAPDPDGNRLLPAGQMHDLRQALFEGPDVADARLATVRLRYPARDLETLCGDDGSLFWADADGRRVTGLLDAMDAAPFLQAAP